MTTNANRTRRIATGIDFGIRGDSLIPADISRALGISPTSGFEKGQPYVGRHKKGSEIATVDRIRPFGVWHFCTAEYLDSNEVEAHAEYLIETLTPAKTPISHLIVDPAYYLKITIWVLGYTFDVSSTRLAGLLPFAEDFTITCWEEKDDDTQ